jgi:hypothetical protein
MTRPRQVLAKQFYMITRSCTQRQFLLRPDDETNNAFAYCLAEAAQRFGIDIVLPMAETNHHHTVIYDPHGRFPAFTEHFHKMLAKCMNARWGRWENFWAAEEVCVTRLLGRDAVMNALVYAATNPVKDFLVEEACQWPGINGYRELIHNKPLCAKRPRHFFRKGGRMPTEVTLELVIPAVLGTREEVIVELRARVEQVEHATREHRRQTGRRILGRRNVLQQSWKASPSSVAPHRRLRPRFAGSVTERVVALAAYKDFLAAYDHARLAWKSGLRALFPVGTYWLTRFAPVTVAPLAN